MNLEICFANFLFHDKSALQIYVAQEMLSISLCVKNPSDFKHSEIAGFP